MHFDTGTANTGDTAQLESRLLYPKRGHQCLQFYYYNTAGTNDTLKIHVREYDSANPAGKLRFVETINGESRRPKSSRTIQIVICDRAESCVS